MGRWRNKTLHVVSAVAILAGAVATAPAVIAENNWNVASTPEYGNIDPNKKGNIVIHKHVHQQEGNKVLGTAMGPDPIKSDPVKDVTFEALKLDVDLTKSEEWEKLEKLEIPADVCTKPPAKLGDITLTRTSLTATTDSAGIATIATGLGAYLVCETARPASVVDVADPFVVTVPFPDHQGSKGWLYDVHVYPKNGTATVKKTVQAQKDLGLGSRVTFPVNAQIAQIAPGHTYNSFIVQDPMDKNFANIGVSQVKIGDDDLVKDTDYKVIVDEATNTVTVALLTPGLKKANENIGKTVRVDFQGDVVDYPAESGKLENTVKFWATTIPGDNPPTDPPTTPPTDPWGPDPEKPLDPIEPTTPVSTTWGDVRIQKHDAGDAKTPLKGAKFEIYEAKNPYAETCTAEIAVGAEPISVSDFGKDTAKKTVFESNEDGLVYIQGLFVADSENEPVNKAHRCYVLKETEAPAGFVTPRGDKALTPVTVKPGKKAEGTYELTVTNTKRKVPELPLTGDKGVLMMLIGGGALILASIAIATVAVRRRKA